MTRTKTIKIWVEGSDPHPLVVDVDPELEPGEVEITEETTLEAELNRVALAAMEIW